VLNNQIKAEGKQDQIELVGAGIGGNKIYDLFLRMDKDVIAQQPDVVVIWVGVNDVWHKASFGTGTDYDKFGIFYDAVVKKIQAAGAKVVVSYTSNNRRKK
jgi:lysophospholipase L1-like esterase